MAGWVALLLGVLLVTHHPGDAALLEANGNLSCRCAKTTRAFISPLKYSSVEVRPVGSSCRRLEVVIKLKSLEMVCVDPNTPWVKKLLHDLPNLRKKEASPVRKLPPAGQPDVPSPKLDTTPHPTVPLPRCSGECAAA